MCTQGLFFAMASGLAWNGLTDTPTVGPVGLGPFVGLFESLLGDEAAEEAAVVGQPAVVGPDGASIPVAITVTNAELKNYQIQQWYKMRHEAMKFLREFVGEANIPGVPSVEAIEMTHPHTHTHTPRWRSLHPGHEEKTRSHRLRHGLGLEPLEV